MTRHRRHDAPHRVLALAAAVGLLLAACTSQRGAEQEDPGANQPLVVGQIAEPMSMDPAAVTAVNDFRILINMYDGLVTYAEDSLEIAPGLAKSWTVSDDGTTYTFELRDDVTFHDGSPFNAQAVKFNFERMLNEDHPYFKTGPFPLAAQYFGQIDSIATPDEHTVEFTLAEPWAPFLNNLAYPTGLIVSPKAVKEQGTGFGRNPVGGGTGAFKFGQWQSQQQVALERNDEWWGGDVGSPGLVFLPLVEPRTRVTELRAGSVDVIVEVPPDDLAAFDDEQDFTVLESEGPHVWFLILNLREEPFDDVRMRRAVNLAIDKEAISSELLRGTATPAVGPMAPAFEASANDQLDGYPYDPEKARTLIEEAGYGDGVDVTFYVTQGGSGMLRPGAMGEAIQAYLADVGVNADIETYEWNTYLSRVNPGLEGKAGMAEMAWMTNDPGTLPFLTLRSAAFPDEGGFNSGYYASDKVDKLINDAQVETDDGKRRELYRQMQQQVIDDAPWVFVAYGRQTMATGSDITGIELHPSFLTPLAGATRSGG